MKKDRAGIGPILFHKTTASQAAAGDRRDRTI